MAAELIVLYLPASSIITGTITTNTTTSVVPTAKRFASTVVLGNISAGTTTIPATSFRDDTDTLLTAGGLTIPSLNGYYNLYVNGVLQLGGQSTLTVINLVINTALTIGVSVVVEVVNFVSTSTSTSTHNLVVSTTITT
ncbi:MAG TPA: DUF4183 domain-containing protein [Paenibacillus sp.]